MPHLSCKRPPPPTACRDGEGCPIGRQKKHLVPESPRKAHGQHGAYLQFCGHFIGSPIFCVPAAGGISTFRRHLSLPPLIPQAPPPHLRRAAVGGGVRGRARRGCLGGGGRSSRAPRSPSGFRQAGKGLSEGRGGGCYSLRKKKKFQAMAFARK